MADWEHEVPDGIDTSIPSIARVYDYVLGGKDNFEVDRALAERLKSVAPEIPLMAVQNREFLRRAVRFLAAQGITQFIDIGTGLPTQHNVHEVVQSIQPDARVVYVDNDPVVLAHARALLADNPSTIVVDGDVRRPADILADPGLRELVDLDQPVAILLVGILYFVAEEDKPHAIVAEYREAMAPGSYLAISHVVSEDRPEAFSAVSKMYGDAIGRPGDPTYTRETVLTYFDGLDMVEPGLVYACDWRNDGDDVETRAWMLGGVARKG